MTTSTQPTRPIQYRPPLRRDPRPTLEWGGSFTQVICTFVAIILGCALIAALLVLFT